MRISECSADTPLMENEPAIARCAMRTVSSATIASLEDVYKRQDYEMELRKVRMAVDMGAESIMDLSNYGKTNTCLLYTSRCV